MGTGENYPGESGEIYSGDDSLHGHGVQCGRQFNFIKNNFLKLKYGWGGYMHHYSQIMPNYLGQTIYITGFLKMLKN